MSARITNENTALEEKSANLDVLAQTCRSFGSTELAGESYTALATYYSSCVAPYITSVKTVTLEKKALNTVYQTALASLSFGQYDDDELLRLITEMTQKRAEVAAACAAGSISLLCGASITSFYDSTIIELTRILEEFHAFENSVSGMYSAIDTFAGYLDQMTTAINAVRANFSPDKPQGVTGQEIAKAANTYVGNLPYVWGAESLEDGADCSGFVRALFRLFGFTFTGYANDFATNTAAAGDTTCTAVPLDELEPGDIVATLRPGGHGHVGIYIGNGQYVNCRGGSSNTESNPGLPPDKGVIISPIPTGSNVYAWRVDGLVEKETPEAFREKIQSSVDACAEQLSSNPLYVSAIYETAHHDEAAYFDSLNEGLRGLPVEDRLGVKNALYGQAEGGGSAFEGNVYRRIVAQSMGNGLSCGVSDTGQTQVINVLHADGNETTVSCEVQISEADLANARQNGYYEVFRAIGNGVDISGPGQCWSDSTCSDITLSDAARSDAASYIEAHAGQGSQPQGLATTRLAEGIFLSETSPSSDPLEWSSTSYANSAVNDAYNRVITTFRADEEMPAAARAVLGRATGGQLAGAGPVPGPGTYPGLEGNQAYFADYFAEGVTGGARESSAYVPKTSNYMYTALQNILQSYKG